LALPPAAFAQPAPVEVDVLISLTGGAGFAGQEVKKSVDLFEANVNAHGGIAGRPLHFIVHDDQTSTQLDVQLMNDITARKRAVVIGPMLAGLCSAVAPLASAGPLDYCLSPSISPPPGSYVFSNGPQQGDLIATMLRYFRDRGIKRIAAITTTDGTGQDADKALAAHFGDADNQRAGLQLVAHEHFTGTDISVSAQIARIKESGAGALVVWTSGTPFGTVLRGLRDAGLELPVGAAPSNMTHAQMTQYAAFLPKELYFSGAPYAVGVGANTAVQNVVNDYNAQLKRAGIAPDYQTGLAWDPLTIVVDALRKVGPDATADQLRAYVASLHGFAALDGLYDFQRIPQRGIDDQSLIVMRYDPARDSWSAVTRVGGSIIR
jgi:branched-chain amino acid transport system substrate-binding protein